MQHQHKLSPHVISHERCQVAKDSSCPLSHWHHRAPKSLSCPSWHSIHTDEPISPCQRSITLSPTLFGFSPLMYLYMERTCVPRPKILLRIRILQIWETKLMQRGRVEAKSVTHNYYNSSTKPKFYKNTRLASKIIEKTSLTNFY